jgi:hypothetical protein
MILAGRKVRESDRVACMRAHRSAVPPAVRIAKRIAAGAGVLRGGGIGPDDRVANADGEGRWSECEIAHLNRKLRSRRGFRKRQEKRQNWRNYGKKARFFHKVISFNPNLSLGETEEGPFCSRQAVPHSDEPGWT